MTVRVEREFELPAPPADVWAFIADPDQRARAISVVEDYETHEDGSAVWQVELPIPLLNRTVDVETEDVRRDDPEFVKFVGRSADELDELRVVPPDVLGLDLDGPVEERDREFDLPDG